MAGTATDLAVVVARQQKADPDPHPVVQGAHCHPVDLDLDRQLLVAQDVPLVLDRRTIATAADAPAETDPELEAVIGIAGIIIDP